KITGHIRLMLYDSPVHIYDIERTVGGRIDIYRTKPFISGSQKVCLKAFIWIVPDQRAVVFLFDDIPLDQVAGRLGHKGVANQLPWQPVATVNSKRTGGRIVAERTVAAQYTLAIAAIYSRCGTNGPNGFIFVDRLIDAGPLK